MKFKSIYTSLPFLLVLWSLILLLLGFWQVNNEYQLSESLMSNEASIHFMKDQAFRTWAAEHGGVYVPVTERTKPSPYLSHIKERDVITESGTELTLMNPAWMLRQLMENYDELYGVKGHITSLNPLREENRADDWESEALRSFGNGEREVKELTEINGEVYLRYMSPIETSRSCLKCHASQGFREGDILGGISVSVPADEYQSNTVHNIRNHHILLLVVGNIGVFSIILAFFIIKKRVEEREKAREDLKNAQLYITDIIDSMPAAIIGLDMKGNVTHWNHQAELTEGKPADAVIGLSISEAIPRLSSQRDKIERAINGGPTFKESRRQVLINGEIHYENLVIYPLLSNKTEGAVIYLYDITAQVEMEEAMIQQDKMLSVGGMASGLAHEINNPLAGMIQTANVMSSRLTRNTPSNERAAEEAGTTMESIRRYMESRDINRMLASINEGGNRVAEIVRNMLDFMRPSINETSTHHIHDIIEETLKLAANDIILGSGIAFSDIDVQREYGSYSLPMIICYKTKLQQVFLNIFHNGAHAMAGYPDRTPQFIIRTDHCESDNMLVIEIEDNGPGMDEKTKRRIFEPFYTTKNVGEGTGLGLSISYFIIKETHKGEMHVKSKQGAGTSFTIKLPLS